MNSIDNILSALPGGKLGLLRSFISQHGCHAEITHDGVTWHFKNNPDEVYTSRTMSEAFEQLGYAG